MYLYDNEYWVPKNITGSTVLPREPEPYAGFHPHRGVPLTVWNDWSDYINNEPIYQYLLPTRKDSFSAFVAVAYKASCAIVYQHEDDPTAKQIVASGCLIANNCIITAAHAIKNFDKRKLYIRFFDYDVTEQADGLYVKESVLDLPLFGYRFAENGADACWLWIDIRYIPLGINAKFKPQYLGVDSKSIPSPGQYSMFHFGNGIHQVSAGQMSFFTPGMPLQQAIKLQGGSGASGAGIIWYAEGFGGPTVYGVSIYRQFSDGNVERRIVPYCEFNAAVAPLDLVKNPYHPDCLNPVLVKLNPTIPGYEFLLWSNGYFGDRTNAPNFLGNTYEHRAEFSNHHIIPIGHMLYLYDYMFDLDQRTKKILHQQAQQDTQRKCSQLDEALADDLRDKVDYDKTQNEIAEQRTRLQNCYEKEKQKLIKKRYDKLHQEALENYYQKFLAIMKELMPIPKDNPQEARCYFAWSYWNLFQGWSSKYRTLDPCHNRGKNKHTTRNEKVRPASFNEDLWNAVQILFYAIEQLRRDSRKQQYIIKANEDRVYQALQLVYNAWKPLLKRVHPYNSDDWKRMGRRYGRKQYILY